MPAVPGAEEDPEFKASLGNRGILFQKQQFEDVAQLLERLPDVRAQPWLSPLHCSRSVVAHM